MFRFLLTMFLIFNIPLASAEPFGCKMGGGTLDWTLSKVSDVLPNRRIWTRITNDKNVQNLFIMYEGTNLAGMFVFIDQCQIKAHKIHRNTILNLFELELDKVFPPIVKG